jgi:hypothetical protein
VYASQLRNTQVIRWQHRFRGRRLDHADTKR